MSGISHDESAKGWQLREFVLPAFFFAFLCWGIQQHVHALDFRESIATSAMLFASLLLLPLVIFGKAAPALKACSVFFWLVLFLIGLSSAYFALGRDNAFEQMQLYFSVFFLGIGFSVWLGRPSRRMISGFLLAFCVAHTLILITVLAFASGLAGDPMDRIARVPFHSNIRHVAHHGMVSACAGLSLFLMGGRLRLAGYLLAVVSIFGLVFLGQRGGLLGLGVFAGAAALFLRNYRRKILITVALIAMVSVATTYVLDGYGIKNRFSGSLVERVETQGTDMFTSSSGRIDIWKSSIELAMQRPLLGNGPDGFRVSAIGHSFRGISQSHNLFFQTLVELGFPGLIIVCWFFYRTIVPPVGGLWKKRSVSEVEIEGPLLFAMLLGFLGMSQVEGLFYHPISLVIFSVLAPLAMAANGQNAIEGASG